MRRTLCGLVLVLGCHNNERVAPPKGSPTGAAQSGSAETGSGGTAMGGAIAGSAGSATRSATTENTSVGSAATAGSKASTAAANSTADARPQVAALDDLDRWLAPLYKLPVPQRYKSFCAAGNVIIAKVESLNSLTTPAGGDPQSWTNAVDNLANKVNGVRMCCVDVGDYDKLSASMKQVADWNDDDCMKEVPDAFAAVVKLVPGAKPPGTHSNDPLMASPTKQR